jgi:hypothetical protein
VGSIIRILSSGKADIRLLRNVKTGSRAHSASNSVDAGEIVPWEMWPRLVAGHISSSGAEVKETWSYTTTPSVCRDKLTSYLCIDLFKPFLEVVRKYCLVILSQSSIKMMPTYVLMLMLMSSMRTTNLLLLAVCVVVVNAE